jgi:hypothetical protein
MTPNYKWLHFIVLSIKYEKLIFEADVDRNCENSGDSHSDYVVHLDSEIYMQKVHPDCELTSRKLSSPVECVSESIIITRYLRTMLTLQMHTFWASQPRYREGGETTTHK